ncbi:hypothetical protein GCM10025771_18400 [Niveibacterium umoris]
MQLGAPGRRFVAPGCALEWRSARIASSQAIEIPKMTTHSLSATQARPAVINAAPWLITSTLTAVLCAASGITLGGDVGRGLLGQPIPILIHLCAAALALGLLPIMLLRRKGDAAHRAIGRVWLHAMVVLAISAIWIQTKGSFSGIHLLVPATLWGVSGGLRDAATLDRRGHGRAMLTLSLALVIAGAFAFSSGRLLNLWFFGA